jgi:hypothetical protein
VFDDEEEEDEGIPELVADDDQDEDGAVDEGMKRGLQKPLLSLHVKSARLTSIGSPLICGPLLREF